jgi:phage shock protein A
MTMGFVGRLAHLVRGIFGTWVKDRERENPRAVYEQAIEERMRQYGELKQAVAGILYMRTKLEAEIESRRAEAARLDDDVARAVRRDDDETAVALIAHRQAIRDELARAERELGGVRGEADEAKANLVRFREEIRSLEREKVRSLATLASAHARRRIQQAFERFEIDAEMRALEGVREAVARAVTGAELEGELGADGIETRLREIRAEARDDAARRELAEIKRRLRPPLLAPAASTPELVAAPGR